MTKKKLTAEEKTQRRNAANAARVQAAAEVLMAHGYQTSGSTDTETVRVPTQKSPVFGGCGGEFRTFGGRARFVLPGSCARATVGANTTSLYEVIDGKATNFRNVQTTDLDELREALRQPKESQR